MSRNVRSSSASKAATDFLISRSRRHCAHRLATVLQGLVSQSGRPGPSVNERKLQDWARLIDFGLIEEATMAIDLRRSGTERFSFCDSIERDSTGDVAIACSKLQYEAPHSANASIKNANTDGPDEVSPRSNRFITGIADGCGLISSESSRRSCAGFSRSAQVFSRASRRNSRP